MNKLVSKHQINYAININLKTKVFFVVSTESYVYAMVLVHHTCYCIKSKPIYLIFCDIPS